jgi:hypothetical protein
LPAILTFDPYLNPPEGAAVPVPPLLDSVVAALARLAGESVAVFEHALAPECVDAPPVPVPAHGPREPAATSSAGEPLRA